MNKKQLKEFASALLADLREQMLTDGKAESGVLLFAAEPKRAISFIPMFPDRFIMELLVKMSADFLGANLAAQVMEAWTAKWDGNPLPPSKREDKQETIVVFAMHKNGNTCMGVQPIDRDAQGKPLFTQKTRWSGEQDQLSSTVLDNVFDNTPA